MNRIGTPRPRLDVRDLELVLAVSTSGSTVRAASALHVTQSAVSRGLILAEEKLGMRLFERTARGLAPTAAGERLIRGAGVVLSQLVELERQTEAPVDAPVRVRLVCECYTAYRWLPSALANLRSTMPSLDVSLALEHTVAPVAALVADEIDVAFLTTASVRGARSLDEVPLFSDEIVFVVAKTHPLAARASIMPADLREQLLITSTHTPKAEAQWFMRHVFGRARPKLEQLHFPLTEAIIDAARAGMGVAVLSEWIASPYLDSGDLVVKRLRGRPLRRPWRMAFRRESEAAAKRLAAALEGAPPRARVRRDAPRQRDAVASRSSAR